MNMDMTPPPMHVLQMSPVQPAQQFGIMWYTAKAFFWRGDHVTSRWVTGTRRYGAWKTKPTLLYPKLFYNYTSSVCWRSTICSTKFCLPLVSIFRYSSYTRRTHDIVWQACTVIHSLIFHSFVHSWLSESESQATGYGESQLRNCESD